MTMLTIGELAKKSDVSTDTIRYYERLDLVQPQRRSEAGYRLYTPESVRIIRFICNAKDLGFTLAETKTLLNIKASKSTTCRDMLASTKVKIAQQTQNIKQLNRIHDVLNNLAEICPGGDMPLTECPILDYLYPKDKE